MNIHAHDWWQKEEDKKKQRHEASEVQLINQRLQRLMHQVEDQVDKSKYEDIANQLERRYLNHCSIWQLAYLNNFENGKAALAQGLFLYHVLVQESMDNQRFLLNEVEMIMRQIGNVDWGLYLTYGQKKGRPDLF